MTMITLIITLAVGTLVMGYDEKQIAPVLGLFGSIADISRAVANARRSGARNRVQRSRANEFPQMVLCARPSVLCERMGPG